MLVMRMLELPEGRIFELVTFLSSPAPLPCSSQTMSSVNSVASFLESTRQQLQSNSWTTLVLCTGNESCDLDSMVSSLTYAMLVHAHADQPHADTTPRLPANCLVLPFWQVNREDIALRQEATWMFESIMHQSGDAIARQIFCLDDLPLLRSMCQTHKSFGGWILCDHNVPTLSFTDTDTVLAIVDHHVDGNAFLDARPRITSMIGSTCSHVCNLYQRNEVGRSFFASQSSINSSNEHNALVFLQSLSPVAAMLLCTILLDTSNNMGRSDDDRAAMIACLKTSSMTALAASESSLFESERSNLFDLLLKLRRDVMGLTCPQLLRKDFKSVSQSMHRGSVSVGVSAVLLPIPIMVAKAAAQTSITEFNSTTIAPLVAVLNEFSNNASLNVAIVMTAFVPKEFPQLASSDDSLNRQVLVVFAPFQEQSTVSRSAEHYSQWCSDFVAALHQTPILQLSAPIAFNVAHSSVSLFEQMNPKATRKQLLPAVEQFLKHSSQLSLNSAHL